MPLSPDVLANFQQSQGVPQGQGVVTVPPTTITGPTAAPPPPPDDRGYLQRGVDWIADTYMKADNAVGNAITHPVDTAKQLWAANQRAGQAVWDANQRAGQAVLNYGSPSQQAAAAAAAAPPPDASQTPPQPTQQQPPPQPMIMPLVTRPAHEVRAVSPGTEALFNQATAQQQAANEQGEQADLQANEAGAQAAENEARVSREGARQVQAAEADRQRRYDATNAEYQRVANEAANGTVTPEKMSWMDRIGSALGAFGAAINHTPNFALEAIHHRIDTQLAADRENLQNKNRAADRKENDLARLHDRFGDERQAEAAYRALKLQEAKAAGDALVGRAQSPILAAKWAGVKAGATADQAKLHNMMFPWQQASTVGGQATRPLDNVFMNVDGQRYQARDADSRKKLAASAEAVQDMTGKAQDYAYALNGVSAYDRALYKLGITTDAMSRAQSAHSNLNSVVRSANDDGVMKMSEVPFLARGLAPPENFQGDPQGQMTLLTKQINDAHAHKMRTEDALPVTQGFVQNTQTGQIAPRNNYTGGTVKPQAPPASRLIREIPK